MSKHLIFWTLFLVGLHTSAQNAHFCGFDFALKNLAEAHDGFRESCQTSHENMCRAARSNASASSRATVYQVPIVFHVVWNTEAQNLPDEVIFDQLEILNQDYRRLNPNANETRPEFMPIAGDAEIEFVLASVDPDGNPTNGINRFQTDREDFLFDLLSTDVTLDEVKHSETGGVDAWDTDHYVNVWICNITANFGAQLFGFAYPPNNAPNWEGLFDVIPDEDEGVVIHYTVVGSNNPSAGDDNFSGNEGGRTLTHEMGHYLGLRHTWGDGFFDGCGVDDGISDTPNISESNNFACNFNANTCNDGVDDQPDMGENYMDYNQDDCLNMFTLEQIDMMRFVLENFRPELIEGQIVSVDDDFAGAEVFKLFPNPAESTLSIQLSHPSTLLIFDLSGRVVMEGYVRSSLFTTDVSGLSKGTYIVQAFRNGRPISQRLVIQ